MMRYLNFKWTVEKTINFWISSQTVRDLLGRLLVFEVEFEISVEIHENSWF